MILELTLSVLFFDSLLSSCLLSCRLSVFSTCFLLWRTIDFSLLSLFRTACVFVCFFLFRHSLKHLFEFIDVDPTIIISIMLTFNLVPKFSYFGCVFSDDFLEFIKCNFTVSISVKISEGSFDLFVLKVRILFYRGSAPLIKAYFIVFTSINDTEIVFGAFNDFCFVEIRIDFTVAPLEFIQ